MNLKLNDEDTNTVFDLAAVEKENGNDPELPMYIIRYPKARTVLPLALVQLHLKDYAGYMLAKILAEGFSVSTTAMKYRLLSLGFTDY